MFTQDGQTSFEMGALIIKTLISSSYTMFNLKDKDSMHCHGEDWVKINPQCTVMGKTGSLLKIS